MRMKPNEEMKELNKVRAANLFVKYGTPLLMIAVSIALAGEQPHGFGFEYE